MSTDCDQDREQAERWAASWGRDEMHALLLARTIELAARTHPELLREALASVFDVKGLLDIGRQAQANFARVQRDVSLGRDMVRDTLIAMRKEMMGLKQELDGLRYELDQVRRMRKAV